MKLRNLLPICYRLNRRLSTVVNDEVECSPRSCKPSAAIVKRFRNCESYESIFTFSYPYLLNKKKSTPRVAYCLDEKIALSIYDALKNRIFFDKTPIIEVNPGLGLLTRHLAARAEVFGVKLLAVDTECFFKMPLWELKEKYPDTLKVYKDIFFQNPKVWYDPLQNPNRDGGFLQEIKPRQWTDDPAFKLVGVLPGTGFLRHFMNSVILRGGITAYGRLNLSFVLDSRAYTNLIKNRKAIEATGLAANNLGALAVLFDLVFDYETLLELDATGFLPWVSESKSRSPSCRYDHTKMYLISATPKRHILHGLAFDDYRHFLFFLRQISHRRLRVIPYFENWLPDCGPRFIAEGIDVFTEFRELSSNRLLEMFKVFISLTAFKSCPFIEASDAFLFQTRDAVDKLDVEHENEVEDDPSDEK